MSVSFSAYVVDLQVLESFFGNGNASKTEKIKEVISDKDPFDVVLSDESESSEFLLTLESFAKGQLRVYDQDMALLAIRSLCETYGEEQDCDEFVGVRVQVVDYLGKGAHPLFYRGFPPPYDTLSFRGGACELSIGYLRKNELPGLLEELEGLLENLSGETRSLYNTILTMIGWYESAIDQKRDLVGFGT